MTINNSHENHLELRERSLRVGTGWKNLFKKLIFLRYKIQKRYYPLRFKSHEILLSFNDYMQLRAIQNFFDESALNEGRILNYLFEMIEVGDVVFDVGANMGLHTVFMAKKVGSKGTVVAVEPDPEAFKILTENISINRLENVMAFQIALGQSDGKGNLYKNKDISFGAIRLFGSEENKSGTEVEIRNGDRWVKEKGFPIPKAVKIDVEGFEWLVLDGLKLTLSHSGCRHLICELHKELFPYGIEPSGVLNIIESYGFKMSDWIARGSEIHAFFKK